MNNGSGAAIEISGLSFSYENTPVLEDINLWVPAGDFLAIIGPNGGGKTTLLKLILGLLKPASGTIRVFGRPCEQGRHEIGYVQQYIHFDRDFPVSAMEVVLMGRLAQAPAWGGYRAVDRKAAEEALRVVEADHLRDQRLGILSGGQRQRVLIARALASQPQLLILDEPTANIDAQGEREIFDLLSRLNQTTTIVIVTHDLAFISSYVKSVACLNRRLIRHPTARITAELIQEMYAAPMQMVQHQHRLGTEKLR